MKKFQIAILLVLLTSVVSINIYAQNEDTKNDYVKSQPKTQTMRTIIEDGRLKRWINGELVEDRDLSIQESNNNMFSFDFVNPSTNEKVVTPDNAPGMVLKNRPKSMLGIHMRDMEQGVIIEKVIKDTPAYESDLKSGDIINKLDGKKASIDLIRKKVSDAEPGTLVNFTISRKDKEFDISVKLKEWKANLLGEDMILNAEINNQTELLNKDKNRSRLSDTINKDQRQWIEDQLQNFDIEAFRNFEMPQMLIDPEFIRPRRNGQDRNDAYSNNIENKTALDRRLANFEERLREEFYEAMENFTYELREELGSDHNHEDRLEIEKERMELDFKRNEMEMTRDFEKRQMEIIRDFEERKMEIIREFENREKEMGQDFHDRIREIEEEKREFQRELNERFEDQIREMQDEYESHFNEEMNQKDDEIRKLYEENKDLYDEIEKLKKFIEDIKEKNKHEED